MGFWKRVTAALGVAGSLFGLTGCEGMLEPNPASFTSTANYYQEPEHFESAINSAYSRLRAQAGISNASFRVLTELRFDCCITDPHRLSTDPSGKPIADWNAAPSNEFFAAQWSAAYHTIAQTNVILGRIDGASFVDETQRDRIIGQAKFLRALSYWYLVQFYGDVPLLLQEVGTPREAIELAVRRPSAEVYQQIVSDLTDAIEKLPARWAQPGRATQGAAKFLLGRTYLLTKEYAQAAAVLEDLARPDNVYGYRLLSEYREIFNPRNTNNAESIVELQFAAGVSGQPHTTALLSALLPYNSRGKIAPASVAVSGEMLVSMELVDRYEAGDARKDATVMWWYDAAADSSKAILKKFVWPQDVNALGQQAGNIILFRYADVLLSLAEAYWRLGRNAEAIALVDAVRARAGLPPTDLGNVAENPLLEGTYLASDPVGRAIFNERSLELAGEGHRMFDLVRFDVALEVMRTWAERTKAKDPALEGSFVIEPFEILLPIPTREIAASEGRLTQNPGW